VAPQPKGELPPPRSGSLAKGDLYSLWMSHDESGASHGYVAGGGPGFTGPTDTVGKAAYEQE